MTSSRGHKKGQAKPPETENMKDGPAQPIGKPPRGIAREALMLSSSVMLNVVPNGGARARSRSSDQGFTAKQSVDHADKKRLSLPNPTSGPATGAAAGGSAKGVTGAPSSHTTSTEAPAAKPSEHEGNVKKRKASTQPAPVEGREQPKLELPAAEQDEGHAGTAMIAAEGKGPAKKARTTKSKDNKGQQRTGDAATDTSGGASKRSQQESSSQGGPKGSQSAAVQAAGATEAAPQARAGNGAGPSGAAPPAAAAEQDAGGQGGGKKSRSSKAQKNAVQRLDFDGLEEPATKASAPVAGQRGTAGPAKASAHEPRMAAAAAARAPPGKEGAEEAKAAAAAKADRGKQRGQEAQLPSAGEPVAVVPPPAKKTGTATAMPAVEPSGRGAVEAAGTSAGAGQRAAAGAAAVQAPPISGAAAPPPLAVAASQPLPPTGTTPFKPFAPAPLPPLDHVGRDDRAAVLQLQRQLANLQKMYDDLKDVRINDLEKVLEEQLRNTEEQVKKAQHHAQLWKAAAERAEKMAREAGSQETAERIATLEEQVAQLLVERSELLHRMAQQEQELAQAQQALHDVRAELLMVHQEQQAQEQQREARSNATDEDGQPAGDGEHAGEVEGEAGPVAAQGEAGQGEEGARGEGEGAGPEASPSQVRNAGGLRTAAASPAAASGSRLATPSIGAALAAAQAALERLNANAATRAIALQFPTPSPGVGVQFPTPGLPLSRLQGLTSLSGGAGVSTECQRVVDMLPHLRFPTPSIQSRLASGAAPVDAQTDAAAGAGPSGAATVAPGTTALPSTKTRRSTGSPIDGICGAGQRLMGATMAADVSFAHAMRAPEAFDLVGPQQQKDYSFVDLNPASACKAPRPAAAGTTGDRATQQCPESVIAAGAPPRPLVPHLLSAAAAAPLPRSPVPGRQAQAAGSGTDSPLQQRAASPLANGRGPIPRASPGRLAGLSAHGPGVSPSRLPGAAALAAAAAAAGINSGSMASNQDSCTVSGLVARAMALQEQHAVLQAQQQQPAPLRSPLNANRTAGAPAAVPAPPPAVVVPLARSPAPGAAAARSPLRAAELAASTPALRPSPSRGAGQLQELAGAQAPADVPAQGPPAASTDPSPRTAKLIMYERMLDWHVDTVCLAPETCRLTHHASGMSFELREVELDDEELQLLVAAGGNAGDKMFTYTPLELGDASDILPSYLKESCHFPARQRRMLLEQLNKALKATTIKVALAAAEEEGMAAQGPQA